MKKLLSLLLALILVMFCVTSASALTFNDQSTVIAVQQALNDAGFDCGTPDGAAGQKTRAAITAYREAHNLKASDQIDEVLLVDLGIFTWLELAQNTISNGTIEELKPAMAEAAENGDGEACSVMGRLSKGSERAAYFAMGVENGNTDCMYRLAEMYLVGDGVDQDIEKSIELLERSGNYEVLAVLYSDGEYLEPDYEKANHYVNLVEGSNKDEVSIQVELSYSHFDEAKAIAQNMINEGNEVGLLLMVRVYNTSGEYDAAGELLEKLINESADENTQVAYAMVWAWEHLQFKGMFYDHYGYDEIAAIQILSTVVGKDDAEYYVYTNYLSQYDEQLANLAYVKTLEQRKAEAESIAARQSVAAEVLEELDQMIELEQYLGATHETIEADFELCDYSDKEAVLTVFDDYYTYEISFRFGVNGTCKEISLRGDSHCGYKLHGVAPGLTDDVVVSILRQNGDESAAISHYVLSAVNGDGFTAYCWDIDGVDVISDISYSPSEYFEPEVEAEYSKDPYAGPVVTPVDEYDLAQYLGVNRSEVENAFGEQFYSRSETLYGLDVFFTKSALYTILEDDTAIEFLTGYAYSQEDYTNTEYVTKITIFFRNALDTPYNIAGIRAGMTKEEVDAYIDTLDLDFSSHLFCNFSGDSIYSVTWKY